MRCYFVSSNNNIKTMSHTTETIQFPAINVPPGCEEKAVQLLRSFRDMAGMMSSPDVVQDSGMRTMTTSVEHALDSGLGQAQVLAAGAKRRPKK